MDIPTRDRRAVLSDIAGALGRERHTISQFPTLLWQQVYNRALARRPADATLALLDRCATSGARRATPWFRQLWAPADATEIVLQGHTDWVIAVTAGETGDRVLTGGRDGTLRLWHARTGRLLTTLDNHGGWIYDCLLYDQDRRALSCGGDRLAQMWNVETGALECAFEHPDEVRGCAVHEGRGLFATACHDGGVRVGSLAGRRLLFGVRAHQDRANTVAFAGDGGLVVSGGRDGFLCLVDVRTGAVARRAATGSGCFRLAVFPGGDRIAVAHANGDLSLWEVDGLRETARVRGAHAGEALGCAVSPDGATVASGGSDASTAVWSAGRLAPIARLHGHGNAVFACAFLSADRVVTGSADASARITTVDGGGTGPTVDLERPLCRGPVFSMVAEPGGTVLAADGFGAVSRVDPAAGTVLARVDLDVEPGPLRLAPGGQAGGPHAVGCPDGEVRLLERESLEPAGSSPCHAGWATSCAWSPDGRELLTTGVDGSVAISRRVFGGGLLPRGRTSLAPEQVHCACWMSDGRVLAGGSHLLAMWDPATGDRDTQPIGDAVVVATLTLPGGIAVGVLGDGRIAVLSAALGDAELLDACSRPAGRAGHDSAWGVWSACRFGSHAIAIGATHDVAIWDVVARRIVARVPIGGDAYSVCAVERPGRTILCVGDTSGHVKVFELCDVAGGIGRD